MGHVQQRCMTLFGTTVALFGAMTIPARAQEAPPVLSPPELVSGYVGVAETLELVSLQLRIETLLGADQAWLQRAWDSAVARPDRPAVLTSLALTAERLFSFVDARIDAAAQLSALDRARARARLADARVLHAYAHGADGDRRPAFERALGALALTNPQAPRVDLRSVPADVARWLAGALDRSVAAPSADPASGAGETGAVAPMPVPGTPAPVTPSSSAPTAVTPVAAADTPVGVTSPPSPQPQGVGSTRRPDYVSMPQAGGLIGCFADAENRDLSGFHFYDAGLTVGSCRATCASKGFAYAGVQYVAYCFCGNSYGKYGPSTACTTPCGGAPSEICGGPWANSVYPATGTAPPVADLGTWWSQQESGLHGIWVRRSGTSTFDAYWAENYVKAMLEITIAGAEVRIRRTQGTDGYTCEYTGTLTGQEVNGTFTCDREPGPMRWRAWIQGVAATKPPVLPPVPPTGGNVPSLLGTWSIACCGDTLSGTLIVTNQQGASFSGRMEGGLWSPSISGQIRGDVVEFERRTDEGPQQWSGRLTGSGAAMRIVAGAWTGAYAHRFTAAQLNWHAEKQR